MLLMNFWRVRRLNRDQIVLAHVGCVRWHYNNSNNIGPQGGVRNVIQRANWHDNFRCALCEVSSKSWKRSL